MATIPSQLDSRWRDLVTGKISPRWQTLPVKMLMKRVVEMTKADPKPLTVAKCVNEVHAYFVKNAAAAALDIARAFS